MSAARVGVAAIRLLLLGAAACLAIGVAAVTLAHRGAGWQPYAAASGSMAPAVEHGDLVLVTPSDEPHPVGSIVAFRRGPDGAVVTHRVVEVLPAGRYRTAGDANPIADSRLVHHVDVVGRGHIVVPFLGHLTHWCATGHLQRATLVGVAGLVALIVRRRRVRRRSGRPSPPDLPVALGLVVASFVAWIVAGPSAVGAGAFTAQTSSTGNTVTAAAPVVRYLTSDGPGDRVSVPVLPLSATAPSATALANYDTDRDAMPGLKIAKGGSGAGESDPVKHQTWAVTLAAPLTFGNGTALALWSSMVDFDTAQDGAVTVYLRDCAAGGGSCITLASDTVSRSDWNDGTADFVPTLFDLGDPDATVAAGRSLRITVIVDGSSDNDMWFAYGTVQQPSVLVVGQD